MSSVWFLGLNLWQAGAVGAPDVARFPGLVQRERAEMEFLSWQAELGAKEYLGWPAPGQGHEGRAPERCAPVSVSPTSLSIQKKPALSMPLTTSASTRTNPTSSLWIRRPSSKQRSRCWPATAICKKAWRDQVVWVDLADRGLRRRSWRQKTGRQTETLPPWKGRYSSNCQRPI